MGEFKRTANSNMGDTEFLRYLTTQYTLRIYDLSMVPALQVYSDSATFNLDETTVITVLPIKSQQFGISLRPQVQPTTVSIIGGAGWHNLAEAYTYCQFEGWQQQEGASLYFVNTYAKFPVVIEKDSIQFAENTRESICEGYGSIDESYPRRR